jgi:thioesterase domain-containing protein
MVEHRSICNTVFWHRDYITVWPDDRMLLFLPYYFDASVCVIFPALAAGAELVLAQPGEERDPSQLLQRIARDKITVLAITPALLRLMLEDNMRQSGPTLRWVCCGGDAMPSELPARLLEQVDLILHNHYGPTEVAVDASCWSCRRGDSLPSVPPIGRPIHNVQVHVLDAHRQPVPVGSPGELYIGGAGVARGYLNDPQLTAERFLPDPFRGQAGARLYRTGDRVRWLADGNLEFLGRLDQQVKVRGYRIELGEIEAALLSAPEVKEAVVTAPDGPSGERRLVAYVVPRPGQELRHPEGTALLRRYLKERLPEYMVPAVFVTLPELPLSPTGKVDRKALPAPHTDALRNGQPSRPPATPLEEYLAGLWREWLQLDQVGVEDNFFELGGNSIDAALLINRLQEKLGEHVSTVALFDAPTVAGLSRHLSEIYPEVIRRLFGPSSLCSEIRNPKSEIRTKGPISPLLVPLQPAGSLTPCFMVHPPGGIVVCYQLLARHLDEERPFYGIRARGLHGEETIPQSLEEMAAEYVAAIRTVQPEGPYHLGGWSMGGVVAYEMAQQLLAQGQRIGSLTLLDTTIPCNPANQKYVPEGEGSGREYGLEISLEELDQLGPEEQLPYLWQHVQKLGLLEVDTPLPVVQQILDDLKRLFHAHVLMANDYAVRPYPGRIILFRPIEVPVMVPTAEDRGWSQVADSVEVHFVPGHHHTMVKEPHVRVLADQLRACWQQAEAKNDS